MDVCLLFSDRLKISENKGSAFFVLFFILFFFLSFLFVSVFFFFCLFVCFFVFSISYFQTKMLKQNIVTVPKGTLTRWNTTPSNTRIKPILKGSACPRMQHKLHFLCVQIKKKKKKRDEKIDLPTDPPDFQAKRANKPFIFLGLIMQA